MLEGKTHYAANMVCIIVCDFVTFLPILTESSSMQRLHARFTSMISEIMEDSCRQWWTC